MKYEGKINQYIETNWLTIENKELIEKMNSSELVLVRFCSNNSQLKIDNKLYTFDKNQVVFLTEFHKVEFVSVSKAKFIKWNKHFYCIINHDSEVGCKGILYYGAVSLPIISLIENELESFKLVWSLLEQEMLSKDSLQEEMLQMTLKRLLVQCTRIYKSQISFNLEDKTQSDIIREYHFLVEKHFKEKHSVADYADLLYKSPKTLSNIFKKLGSKTPLQFIKDRRLLEAKRLLSFSNYTISEVGFNLGFSDVQSFSRFFKRESGISPINYREN